MTVSPVASAEKIQTALTNLGTPDGFIAQDTVPLLQQLVVALGNVTGGSGGATEWGTIIGTLSNQTDLQDELNDLGLLQDETIAFRQAIIAAGTSIDATTVSALDELIVNGKTKGWWDKGDEIGVFLGSTLAGQMLKLKTPGAASFVPTNFTDADVDFRTGFGPGSTNTNKHAVSDYVPSANGRSSTDFCFAVSTLGLIGEISNSCVFSSIGGASLFKLVLGQSLGGIFGQTGSLSIPVFYPNGGLHTYSFASNFCTRYNDDALMSGQSISSVTLDQAISLFRSSFNSTTVYATGKIGFVFMGGALTSNEAKALGAAVRLFETRIGRRQPNPFLACFGDSITWGSGATVQQTGRFSAIVSRALGMSEMNFGIQGSTLMGTSDSSGIVRYADLTRCQPNKIMIMYGTNDAGSAYTSTFLTNYNTILSGWISAGISPQSIIVCSLPYCTAVGRPFAQQLQYANAARAAALTAGCVYVDIFGLTLSNAVDIGVDTVHPTNTGHANIARAVLEAVRSSAPRGLIGVGRGINIGAAINSDQAINMTGTKWRIDKVVLANASADITASGCLASLRDDSGGGGNALVAAFDFTNLTAAGKLNTQTLAAIAATDVVTANPLYFRIGAATHASQATVDVMIYGECLYP